MVDSLGDKDGGRGTEVPATPGKKGDLQAIRTF